MRYGPDRGRVASFEVAHDVHAEEEEDEEEVVDEEDEEGGYGSNTNGTNSRKGGRGGKRRTKVKAVVTADGCRIVADAFVNAAGNGAEELAALAGDDALQTYVLP